MKKKNKKEKLKYRFETIEHIPANDHCYYSGLPSPSAYKTNNTKKSKKNKK